MNILYLDTETFSPVDIEVHGLYNYAPACEILIITWALDQGPVNIWTLHDGVPPDEFIRLFNLPMVKKVAHNAQFDRIVLDLGNLKLPSPIEGWDCTMIQCAQHALPLSLAAAGACVGLPADLQKEASGKKLINRFCKPAPSNHKASRYDRASHPELWEQFCEYAKQDIVALRELHRRLPTYNWQPEHKTAWHLDQRINQRGIQIDLDLARAGALAAVREKKILQDRCVKITGGIAPTQRAKMLEFLNHKYSAGLESTAKPNLEPIIEDATQPEKLRELCEIIIASNKTSTSKYAAIREKVNEDGRLRGSLQFSGATRTRRWAGRGFQPQNLPSRDLPKPADIEAYMCALRAGNHTLFYKDLMRYGAAAIRGLLVPRPGNKLLVSDLSNIEGRILAHIARENWKIAAFEAFDAGCGPDLYNVTASGILGIDPMDVSKADRDVFGKVPDLSFGYEGGVAAVQKSAKGRGIKMADHWPTISQSVSPALVARAESNWRDYGESRLKQNEPNPAKRISQLEWVASETIKLAWRERHPAAVSLWARAKAAAIDAIRDPGLVTLAGRLTFRCDSDWLLCKLPSGQSLTYYKPELEGDFDRPAITYLGYGQTDTTARIWGRQKTYGGKLIENACQAIAGDVLKVQLAVVDAAGYAPVLTVHDEIVCDVPDTDEYNLNELNRLLSAPVEWAPGLPLAADGFAAKRYRK